MTNEYMYDLTVVVPTINLEYNPEFLGFNYQKEFKVQVVAVIQGDERPTVYESKEWGDVVKIFVKWKGASLARNLGMDAASSDIVIFLDDDVISSNAYLKHVLSRFYRSNIALLISRVVYSSIYPENKNIKIFKPKLLINLGGSGSGLAIRKKFLTQKNIRFDESIGPGTSVICGEDTGLCVDIFKAGLVVEKSNFASCIHPLSGSTFHRRDETFIRSYVHVVKRCYGLWAWFLISKFSARLVVKEFKPRLALRVFCCALGAGR